MSTTPLLAIGIMTGNSLDGADLVLTAFHENNEMQDLCSHFFPFDEQLYLGIRSLQKAVAQACGNMESVAEHFQWQHKTKDHTHVKTFDQLQNLYIEGLADAVQQLVAKAKREANASHYDLNAIDIIGLHGQTCDHTPPSKIGGFDQDRVYTVQIGNGQQLANLTGITVAYDFRSDDLMHQGEAAPLAPIHHQHLASSLEAQSIYPVTFCNAGNTGNLTHITHSRGDSSQAVTLGWDAGPFNHYSDYLMRTFRKETCDKDGLVGSTGKINLDLFRSLFDTAVLLEKNQNYLLQPPPKSGDPNFYTLIPELNDQAILFEDRVRTVQYFAAYNFVHSLSLTPQHIQLPSQFALFGGGWLNPVPTAHFQALLTGDSPEQNPVLREHQAEFKDLRQRLKETGQEITVQHSIAIGIDGTVMEARIFADMARCRLMGIPFSTPETTGAIKPIVGGLIRYPQGMKENTTAQVRTLLSKYKSEQLTLDKPKIFDPRWSRAVAGWAQYIVAGAE